MPIRTLGPAPAAVPAERPGPVTAVWPRTSARGCEESAVGRKPNGTHLEVLWALGQPLGTGPLIAWAGARSDSSLFTSKGLSQCHAFLAGKYFQESRRRVSLVLAQRGLLQ